MKRLLPLMLLLPVIGCAPVVNESAICEATAQDRTNAAAAVATDGGNLSVVAVQTLISRLDAGCGE